MRLPYRKSLVYILKINAETLLNHMAVLKGINKSDERKELVKALLEKTNLYQHRKKNLSGYSG